MHYLQDYCSIATMISISAWPFSIKKYVLSLECGLVGLSGYRMFKFQMMLHRGGAKYITMKITRWAVLYEIHMEGYGTLWVKDVVDFSGLVFW